MMATPERPVLCSACKHRDRTPSSRPTCLAFPAGIPGWFLDGLANHRYASPGDRGLRFEPADDAPNSTFRLLEELFP